MNRGSLKTRFISEVDGDDSENLQKNCYVAALSAQIYMIMYILMFSAAFALRKKQPDLPRPYKIPGGIWGIGVVCGLGISASGSAFLAGFIPPDNIRKLGIGYSLLYSGLLGLGTAFFLSLPLLLLRHEKKIRQHENEK